MTDCMVVILEGWKGDSVYCHADPEVTGVSPYPSVLVQSSDSE